jgi:excinuclease ABC subunit A
MPIEEAVEFFGAIPAIARHLRTLVDVGLGYVRLGQPAPTLSGGEAQRVKLASELQKRSTGRTVYVLDEPTTGLHFEDIRKLLGVLGRLVDAGNTVMVIEHNLDVVKTADWLIDLGPEGGTGGGLVVAEGTPEQVAADDTSHTGVFLKPVLGGRASAPRRRKTAASVRSKRKTQSRGRVVTNR